MRRSEFISRVHEAEDESQKFDSLYRATAFWAHSLSLLIDELSQEGLEKFRRLEYPLRMFVPTYGFPGSGLSLSDFELLKYLQLSTIKSKQIVENCISGYSQAFSDYRLFRACSDALVSFDVASFSESSVGDPLEQFFFDGKYYSRSSLNYLLGLCYIESVISNSQVNTVLEIGGGYGSLGEILNINNRNNLSLIHI